MTRASLTPLRAIPVIVALFFNVVLVAPATSLAEPTLALTGSAFDATDGNLVVNGDETDWCSPGLGVVTKNDLPSGQGDDSYAEGAKEHDTNPPVEFGSIPNNKVDLVRTYVASETGASGDLFVYVGWVRADDNGTGTISFELNQSGVLLSNGVNHQRTAGDLLITFDFGGGQFESLEVNTWTGSAWGPEVDLVATGLGEGSVNQVDVADCIAGGTIDDLKFGEFSFNLTDLIGGECRSFASVFAKSRASNPIESKLKELIKPASVDFSTCGQITILKQDENQQALGGATFSVTPNPYTLSGSLSVTDDAAPDDDGADGTIHLSDVEPGTYTVCETAAPAGYIIDIDCQELTVAVNGAASFGPFINGLGDISWTKVDAQSRDALCCAGFGLEGIAGAAVGTSLSVIDNGTNDGDADPGELLVTGLKLGTYRITEVTPPAGYDLPDPAFIDVVLAGESASASSAFEDAPQADTSIAKTAVVDPIVAGDDASFDVVVSAGGTGDSEDVVLTDLNDTGHDWVVSGTDAAACADVTVADGETLSCDFGTVPNGESRTVTITMASDPSDCELGIANTASVSSSNDHDASNNEASDSITVLCPNPGVTKTAEVDPIVAGEDAVFTVTVTAGGTGAAANVVLSDPNDTGHDWVVSGADAAACADLTVADGETLTCTWASVPAGQSRTVVITATSDSDDCAGGIANSASITADADVDTSNNEASDSVEVLCPNPGVTKTADVDPIVAGDPASFIVVVSATGTGSSENVALTDLNDTGHDWLVSGADAAACADLAIADGEALNCAWASIPVGQSRTVVLTMTSSPDDCAQGIANTASITADADVDTSNNEASDSIVVDCPDVEVIKDAADEMVSAGDEAAFTILTSNLGEGDAYDVVLTDELPAVSGGWSIQNETWASDCAIDGDAGDVQTLTCGPEDIEDGASRSVTVVTETSVADCGQLDNLAVAEASNESAEDTENNADEASIVVECPGLNITKDADDGEIVVGEVASFTITVWNAGPGDAHDVSVSDDLPAGVVWEIELVDPDADDSCASSLDSEGNQAFSCEFGTLAPTDDPATGGKVIVVSGVTDGDSCGILDNTAFADASNNDDGEISDDATISVRCPTLVIDKAADAEVITISGPTGSQVASPAVVTWTLTYTLTDGPVTNAVITDELPAGLVYVAGSASDGGQLVEGVLTWSFPTLSESGSVTFQTTVDVETISRTAPTVNVAVIASDQTPEDTGQDEVRVTVEPPVLGGTPTPRPSVPDTAVGIGLDGRPVSVPIELLAVLFIGSLGALAFANVRAAQRRRR